jgi:putative heme iron utilization protein
MTHTRAMSKSLRQSIIAMHRKAGRAHLVEYHKREARMYDGDAA